MHLIKLDHKNNKTRDENIDSKLKFSKLNAYEARTFVGPTTNLRMLFVKQ